MQWPLILFDCISVLLHDILKVTSPALVNHDSVIKDGTLMDVESTAAFKKGELRATLVILLLDTFATTLIAEYKDPVAEISSSESSASFIKLVCQINCRLLFVYYLQKLYNYYVHIFENNLQDKLEVIVDTYHHLVAVQFEAICISVDSYMRILQHELKKVMESCFFNAGWDADIGGAMSVKRVVKSKLLYCMSALVHLDISPAFRANFLRIFNQHFGSRRSADAGRTIKEDLLQQLALMSCENVVRAYIEQLLLVFGHGLQHNSSMEGTHQETLPEGRRSSFSLVNRSPSSSTNRNSYAYFYNSGTSSAKTFRLLDVNIINRLNEDLQLLLALSEDLRLLLSRDIPNIHIIAGKKLFRGPLQAFYMKYMKSGTLPRADTAEESVMTESAEGSATTKQLFDDVWKALQHVIYAVQMSKQFLPQFVQDCLYRDFGYVASIKFYVFALHWRGEPTEIIESDYRQYFSNWAPDKDLTADYAIPIIHSIKAANVVKL